ncbi:MAG: hypothetical protein AB7E60_04415 [Sphingobium sp.]
MSPKHAGRWSGTFRDRPDGGRRDRFLTIGLPLPHDGVGKALRAIFPAARQDMPQDMMELLMKLD